MSISYKDFVNNRIASFTDTLGKYTRALIAVTTRGIEDSMTQGASLKYTSLRTIHPYFSRTNSCSEIPPDLEWKSRSISLSLLLPPPFRSAKVRPDYLFKAHRRVHNLILCRPVNQMINIKWLTN